MNALVVDDSAFMRQVLSKILYSAGFNQIFNASNGFEAINEYKEKNPDVVFMDITMPKMNGLQALQVIKTYNSDAVVIMCSAMGQQAFIMKALKEGANDFIVKPFSNDKILEVLHNTGVL